MGGNPFESPVRKRAQWDGDRPKVERKMLKIELGPSEGEVQIGCLAYSETPKKASWRRQRLDRGLVEERSAEKRKRSIAGRGRPAEQLSGGGGGRELGLLLVHLVSGSHHFLGMY